MSRAAAVSPAVSPAVVLVATLASTLACAVAARPLSAQLAWDTPALVGPHAPAGLSVFLVDPWPGDRLGALAQWRAPGPVWSFGYRGALAQGLRDELEGFAGIDVSRALAGSVGQADVRFVAWGGAGLGVGNDLTLSVPLGVVAGWSGLGDGTAFSPYAGVHVVFDLTSAEGDNARVDGVFDFGLDLRLAAGWVARFGGSIGGRDAFAIGIRVPSGGTPE